MPNWQVYVVRTRHGALYTGVATDVPRRIAEHEAGGAKGAKYLRSKGPLELVYQAAIGDRALAQRIESGIKKLSRQEKENLILARPAAGELLKLLAIESAG